MTANVIPMHEWALSCSSMDKESETWRDLKIASNTHRAKKGFKVYVTLQRWLTHKRLKRTEAGIQRGLQLLGQPFTVTSKCVVKARGKGVLPGAHPIRAAPHVSLLRSPGSQLGQAGHRRLWVKNKLSSLLCNKTGLLQCYYWVI